MEHYNIFQEIQVYPTLESYLKMRESYFAKFPEDKESFEHRYKEVVSEISSQLHKDIQNIE